MADLERRDAVNAPADMATDAGTARPGLRRLILPLLLASALANPATGAESPAAAWQSGAAALAQGDWNTAVARLSVAQAAWPNHPDVAALLGLARYHQGAVVEAERLLRRAVAGGTAYDARARYYLGLCRSRLGDVTGATAVFSELLRRHPDSPEALRLAPRVPQAALPSPWHLRGSGEALLQAAWDTNPQLLGDTLGTPPGTPDAQVFAHLGVATTVIHDRLPGLELALGLTGSVLRHERLTELDTASAGADIDLRLVQADSTWSLGWRPAQWWLDDSRYALIHTVQAAWRYRVRGGLRTSLEATWTRRITAPAWAELDAHTGDADGRAAWPLGDRWEPVREVEIRAGGGRTIAEVAQASEVHWSAGVALRTAGPWDGTLDWSIDRLETTYDGAAPGFPAARDEHRMDLGLRWGRALDTWLWLDAGASLGVNRSSLEVYDYEQWVFSLGLAAAW